MTGPTTQPTETTPSSGASAQANVYAQIVALARVGTSRHGFYQKALRCITRSLASPYAAYHVRLASEVLQDDWHTGPTDPAFWKTSLQQFLTESLTEPKARAKLLQARSGDTNAGWVKTHRMCAFLSAPIVDATGSAIGAAALVLAPISDAEVPRRLATLEALSQLMSYLADHLDRPDPTESAAAPGAVTTSSHAAARTLADAATVDSTEELAFAITNELRSKTDCQQTALGLVVRQRVRILSISGLDDVPLQSPGVSAVAAAMNECLDADAPIVEQAGGWVDDRIHTGYRLHRQWHGVAKGDAVASIPLHVEKKPAVILSLRRRADQPFTQEQIDDIRARVEPFAPALLLTRKADRGLVRHAADAARGSIDALIGPGRCGAKILTAVVVGASAWFACGSMDYDLAVPCVVTAAQIRHVTAPFDGVLISAPVLQGDRITKGDILCSFDRRDLNQQRAELSAELAVLEREQDRAMAAGSPAEVQLARANEQLVRTRLEIATRRIERAVVRAPIDGAIVRGDLRKHIGAVVARGDPLFEVAPLDRWTLELEVPESAAADLSHGLTGVFASYARPDRQRTFTVARVHAAARTRRERNVYVAEARIDARDAGLRPGMEGVAKIHLGPRPVWWVTLHRVLDYLRMRFWL